MPRKKKKSLFKDILTEEEIQKEEDKKEKRKKKEITYNKKLKKNRAKKGIKKGVISKGMIPKVEACVHAVNKGVKKAHLIDGTLKHSLLLEIFTDKGVGTEIVKNGYK